MPETTTTTTTEAPVTTTTTEVPEIEHRSSTLSEDVQTGQERLDGARAEAARNAVGEQDLSA